LPIVFEVFNIFAIAVVIRRITVFVFDDHIMLLPIWFSDLVFKQS